SCISTPLACWGLPPRPANVVIVVRDREVPPPAILIQSIILPGKGHRPMVGQEVRPGPVPQGIIIETVVAPVSRSRVGRIARSIPRFHELPFIVVAEPVPMPVLHRVRRAARPFLERC